MKYTLLLAAAMLALFTWTGCSKDDQAQLDRDAILQYLNDKGLSATEHSSGIFHIIDPPGSGGNPTLSSTVTVKYKGYYLDGVVFDQTTGSNTATFALSGLIEGWKIAIPLLQKGGKGLFLIPSGLAYGAYPPAGVRSNAPMAFEIELVSFK